MSEENAGVINQRQRLRKMIELIRNDLAHKR